MKIVSEKQLTFIKTEYRDLINKQSGNYQFDGGNKTIFDNLVLFADDTIYNQIRNDHYLSMTNCERVWNKYFFYLRYQSNILKNSRSIDNLQQPIYKVLEEIYQTCESIDDKSIESFLTFASDFDKQEYILFDYFHPAITKNGISLKSEELNEIVKILKIENFDFNEIDKLILQNIDNQQADLLIFRNRTENTFIKVDTFSAGEDQIHPIDILVRCKSEHMEQIDILLVSWWTKFWKKMGPFVAISILDKFEKNKFYKDRNIIEK